MPYFHIAIPSAICLAVCALGAAETAAPAGPVFADGDIVSLVGDSITHNGKWHGYVAAYYATRFPTRTVRFYNAGISGDTAYGALSHVREDALRHHPTAAVVMLGMNDVGRNDYRSGTENDAAVVAKRATSLANYRKNMTDLTQHLLEGGIKRLVFVTPSPFDDTSTMERENLPGVNAALATCGSFVQELAHTSNAGLVDFHDSLTALGIARQRSNPKATVIGPDRVHPGPEGSLLMAWRFLKDQGAPALVSRVELDVNAATCHAEGATVNEVDFTGGVTATLTVTESALPWVHDPAAAAALSWAPIDDDLNRELFVVKGLAPGSYHLAIDDIAVGGWTADELANGINLAHASTAPQVRQAERVRELCTARTTLLARLRTLTVVEQRWAHTQDPLTPASLQALADERIAANPASKAGINTTLATYTELKAKEAASWDEVEQLTQRMYAAAQPTPHRYVLRRAGH